MGGASPGEGNIVGFNGISGVYLGTSHNNRVQGNHIGTNASGDDLGNAAHGVDIFQGSGNAVGGVGTGKGNIIAFNDQIGVLVGDPLSTGNAILGNRVFANGGIGIELVVDFPYDGVTPNDGCGDADPGPNGFQNFPVLASVLASGATTTVDYDLDTAPGLYRVEFFTVDTPDPSGHGEGRTFVWAQDVTVSATCVETFQTVVPAALSTSQSVTATATPFDAAQSIGFGGTSEFSAAAMVEDPGPTLTITLTPENPPIVLGPDDRRFAFNARVENRTDQTITQDVWLTLLFPRGREETRVFEGITLAPGAAVERRIKGRARSGAPVGTYTVRGRMGEYPDFVGSEDAFTFEKTGPTPVAKAGSETEADLELEEDAGWVSVAGSASALETAAVPEALTLGVPSPNPSRGVVTLRYGLPETSQVRLAVYDALGREAGVLVDGSQPVGLYETQWDASALPAGVYLVRLEAGRETRLQRITVVR